MKAFDVLSVAALLALQAVAGWQLAVAIAGGAPVWLLGPSLVAAVLAADLVSGVVHWVGDRFFAESTPLVGRMLIRPFREHHADPLAITRHGFFELCGNNAAAVVVPMLLVVRGGGPGRDEAAFALHAFVLLFSLLVFATNQVHKWAHAPRAGALVRLLQASGLILPPERHARHHRGDFSQAYCVTTGWL
ncbi:MAG: fatty acid desaturase CarF family protein, partial [Thermodesulfobacteriota bacterium]